MFLSRMCVEEAPGKCLPVLLFGAVLESNELSMYLIVDQEDFLFLNTNVKVYACKISRRILSIML